MDRSHILPSNRLIHMNTLIKHISLPVVTSNYCLVIIRGLATYMTGRLHRAAAHVRGLSVHQLREMVDFSEVCFTVNVLFSGIIN